MEVCAEEEAQWSKGSGIQISNSGCTKTAAAREVEFESDQPILAWLLLLLTGVKEPPWV